MTEISFLQNANLLEPSRGPSNVPRGYLAYGPYLHWQGQGDESVSFLTTCFFLISRTDTVLERSSSFHFIFFN